MRKAVFIFVLFVLITICFGFSAEAQYRTFPGEEVSGTPMKRVRVDQFKVDLLKVMDVIIRDYGQADLSDLVNYVRTDKWSGPNPVLPFIALGHSYLNRYETAGMETANLTKALENFEFVISEDVYPNWGKSWASLPTFSHVLKALARLRADYNRVNDVALRARIKAFDLHCEQIGEGEGDLPLGPGYPLKPNVSGLTDGDSKGEEDFWIAGGLAHIANSFPNHPRAGLWNAQAKKMAYYSLVRRSEGILLDGQPFSTIEDNNLIMNHWVLGNGHYQGGTVEIAQMGALAYRIKGEEIPAEFRHNVAEMYNAYKAMCAKDDAGRFVWTRESDPIGDPTVFPIPGMNDDAFMKEVVHQKAGDGYLWISTEPITGKLVIDPKNGTVPGSSLGTAIQNGKTFMYYMDAYLWHYPPIVSN